jgi:hypothetical protein
MPLSRSSSSVPSSSTTHPFQNATGLLVVIPDKIDVEEESRLYDELCDVRMCRMLQGKLSLTGSLDCRNRTVVYHAPRFIALKALRRSFRTTYGSMITRVRAVRLRGACRSVAGPTSVTSWAVHTSVRLPLRDRFVVEIECAWTWDSVRLCHTNERGRFPPRTLIDIIHSTQIRRARRYTHTSATAPLLNSIKRSGKVYPCVLCSLTVFTSRTPTSPTNNTLSPRSHRNHPCRATDLRFLTTDGDSCSIGFLPCCCIRRLGRVRR